MPEDQSFEVRCAVCLKVESDGRISAGRWRGTCSSGRIREKALLFAASHHHRDDPFTPR